MRPVRIAVQAGRSASSGTRPQVLRTSAGKLTAATRRTSSPSSMHSEPEVAPNSSSATPSTTSATSATEIAAGQLGRHLLQTAQPLEGELGLRAVARSRSCACWRSIASATWPATISASATSAAGKECARS